MSLPVVVGFGIDDADKARRACGNGVRDAGADGVVVGTAIVKAIEESRGDVALACERAAAVVTSIRAGLTR
jgi:tryptophan synthase alpha chain